MSRRYHAQYMCSLRCSIQGEPRTRCQVGPDVLSHRSTTSIHTAPTGRHWYLYYENTAVLLTLNALASRHVEMKAYLPRRIACKEILGLTLVYHTCQGYRKGICEQQDKCQERHSDNNIDLKRSSPIRRKRKGGKTGTLIIIGNE